MTIMFGFMGGWMGIVLVSYNQYSGNTAYPEGFVLRDAVPFWGKGFFWNYVLAIAIVLTIRIFPTTSYKAIPIFFFVAAFLIMSFLVNVLLG